MYKANLNTHGLRQALLLGAASVAAVAFAAPAMAQDQSVETVVVTGSRIPQTGLYSTSPVTSLGQQDIKLTGTANLETVLRSLPSVVGDTDNQFTNNGSGGLSLVDLRGLGNVRTLILVDGKRLMPSDTSADVDISVIPPDLVDHVEVLTGGASAVYGSDAVAGVVNFILRKDFEGAEVDAQYGQTNSNDGQTTDVTGILGFNSANGKGNITIYGEYQNRQAIFQGDRDYSSVALASPIWSLGAPDCASAGFPSVFGGFCPLGSSSSQEGNFKPTGSAVTYHATASNTLAPGTTFYNFNPVNYFQTPDVRYSFGATGHYEVSKALDFYTRLTFSDSQVGTQLAPTPIISTFSTNFANPFLSNQERALLFACYPGCAPTDTATFGLKKRLVETGNRVDNFDHQMYQMVVGAKGDLGGGWSYDVSAQYGRALTTQRLTGDAKFNNFQQGLLVGGTAANPVCLDPSGGCVPINIWTTNSITPEAAAYFALPMTAVTHNEQWDIQGSIVGDLGQWGIQSPWAKNPVAFSAGAEYRQEKGSFEPDDNLGTGNDLGFGQSAPVHGGYNVKEVFTEVRVPLIENMPFAELLQVDGAYRYSSYNTAGTSSTYKYSAEWQPVDDIRFRGSVERAVRAPNISELFGAQSDSANPGQDPCSSSSSVTTTAALCTATGVPAGQVFSPGLVCPAGQCEARVGGNPNLKPEVADTKSVGFVFTPTFIDGFNATVDYYDIKVDGFITGLPIATVLNECYSTTLNPTQDPNNAFCQLVHRNAAGEIFGEPVPPGGDVTTLESNIAAYRVKGYDVEANYNAEFADWGMDSSWGGFALNFKGSLMTTSDFQPDPTSPVEKCAGLYGDICPNSAPTPKWRHNLRLTWFDSSNDVSLSLLWRHISSTTFDEVKFNGLVDPLDAHIPSFDWFDLSGTWAVNDRVSLRGGITNLFDKKPPIIDFEIAASSVDSGNTFPGVYDPVGRTYFAGATIKF